MLRPAVWDIIPAAIQSLFMNLLALHLAGLASAINPWDADNFSPRSRTLLPARIYGSRNGDTGNQHNSLFPQLLTAASPSLVLDFGKEVGGYTTVEFGASSTKGAQVSFAWSESTYYIHGGDHSNGGSGPDGLLSSGAIAPNSSWTASDGQLRGGFRYLAIRLTGTETEIATTSVEISGASLEFTAAPTWGPDPSQYRNHFHSSDALLNRIWYGCAYTVQLCSIQANHARQWPPPSSGWANNATGGVGTSILVDGAKRDRTIWPGDMGVSTMTAFTTTGDTYSSQMSLETLYSLQLPSGMLPYAGPPVNYFGKSDTYHLVGGTHTHLQPDDKTLPLTPTFLPVPHSGRSSGPGISSATRATKPGSDKSGQASRKELRPASPR